MSYNDDEIICYCMDVTVQQIKQAIQNGATTVDLITEQTNAGLACGTCIEDLENILQEMIKK